MKTTTMLHLSLLATLSAVAYRRPCRADLRRRGWPYPVSTLDRSDDTTANNGRVGFFSDIYYDPNRNEWWGLSDRGPGGGSLNYATRLQRFNLSINPVKGKISDFAVIETLIFRDESGEPA